MSNRQIIDFINEDDDRIELFENQGIRTTIDIVWSKIQ